MQGQVGRDEPTGRGDVQLAREQAHLERAGRLHRAFLARHTEGLEAALSAARADAPDLRTVAAGTGLAEDDVAAFYAHFARSERTVTCYSQGVNQSSAGTDKVNAIINVHLATGRIGRPGMGPFSFTGQPNAMGGREVGGLANQLAAHMELDEAGHWEIVREFWSAPNLARQPGLKAVELFEAVADGRIKALWIMATNPAVSLPDVNKARQALQSCPFVVVSDCEDDTDLKPYAHVRFPAMAWGEKDGTVTNSERRISRQRPFLAAPGEARPDWWMVTELAHRLGHGSAFPYRTADEIFREHARLSGFRNEGSRRFDIGSLSDLDARAYDALRPIQWPVTMAQPYGAARLFGDGQFSHDDGKARMLALAPRNPAHATDAAYPLVLNSGRIRDQWHTMTRTARSPRLNRHLSEPFAEIHPEDTARYGVENGALARLQSRWGEALARVKVSADQRAGSVFMPMHWGDRFARHALVNALVNPEVDPVSGEPESKHTPVRITAYRPAWHGFLISREAHELDEATWRVCVRGNGYWLYELAGEKTPDDWSAWSRQLIDEARETDEWLEFADLAHRRYRSALLREGRLAACLFVGSGHELPSREWLLGLFDLQPLPTSARASLLAGRPASSEDDRGRIVCACFGVGLKTLQQAIGSQKLDTPERIGASLKAGTNCGSCIPELKALIKESGV